MRARRSVVGALGAAFLLGSAVCIGAAIPAAAASPCPVGKAAVTTVHYVIFEPDGTSDNVTHLHGKVQRGDQINVLFNVPPLPAGCSDVTLSLVSYESKVSPRHTSKLVVFQSQSQQFIAGGGYEMQVTIVPTSGPRHFQVDFVTGPVLPHPHYGHNVIASARH